jgi:hypothetical protein
MSTTRRWSFTLILPLVVIAVGAQSAGGQVDSGARVRVTTDSLGQQRLVGTLLSADSDSLRLRSARDHQPVAVSTASVVRLEQSHGRRTRSGHGAAVGALVGGGAGLLLGLIASGENDSWFEIGPGEIAAASVFLAAGGALIGVLIGAASHTERWEPVPVPGSAKLEAARPRWPLLKLSMRF